MLEGLISCVQHPKTLTCMNAVFLVMTRKNPKILLFLVIAIWGSDGSLQISKGIGMHAVFVSLFPSAVPYVSCLWTAETSKK